MRLGQEFDGYAQQVKNVLSRIVQAIEGLYELPLGGTAVGTGLNAPPGFASETIAEIARLTGCPFIEAKNHFEAQASKDAVVNMSGALRGCAVTLTKIANDVRWLGSGPRCGLGELKIPPVQPGSSIMPGKVNPVIAESLLMVCAQVIGYDATIAWCGAAGNFELNVMMPVMAWDIVESITLLSTASRNFEHRLVAGLEADPKRALGFVEQSLAMGTSLAPEIGYDAAATLVKNAYLTGRTVREVALEQSALSGEKVRDLLDPETQAG
jgi:fumarate hydratase class II